MSHPDGAAGVSQTYPAEPSAWHYQPGSVLTSPVVTDHPDNDSFPAVHIAYGDGSWAWVTDPAAARANAAVWADAADRLDAMNAARAAAGKAAA